MICDMNCLNCKHPDCINDEITSDEMKFSDKLDGQLPFEPLEDYKKRWNRLHAKEYREKCKKRYQANKEYYKKQSLDYYNSHLEVCKQARRDWYHRNRELILQRQKEQREANRKANHETD